MRKFTIHFCLWLFAATALGCGGTEIDNSPPPIKWGETVFQPESTEKSRKQEVWNKVSFSGYGKKGTIGRVVISGNETLVENISMPGYAADKVILKGVSGDYKAAFNLCLSGSMEDFFIPQDQAAWPKVHIDYFSASNEKSAYGDSRVEVGQVESRDVSPGQIGRTEASDIVIREGGNVLKIKKIALNKVIVPEDVENDPEKLLIDHLELASISMSEMNASADKISVNYSNGSLQVSVAGASVSGAILAFAGISNPPEQISGSLDGSARIEKTRASAQASLDLRNLLELKFDMAAKRDGKNFERLNFTLKDLGAVSYLSDKTRAELVLLAAFVPGGSQAIIDFLSRPGQTLTGKVALVQGEEEFSFSVE